MKSSFHKPLLALMPATFLLAGNAMAESNYHLRSPDKRNEIRIRSGDRIRYDVLLKGKPLLQDSTLSIDIDHTTFGLNPKIVSARERSSDQLLEPVVRQKFAMIRENYNELRLEMEGGYAVVFRAYNEGAAYRMETSLPPSQVKVYREEADFNFANDYKVYYPPSGGKLLFPQRKKIYSPASAGDCS